MSIKPTMTVPIFDGKVTVYAFGREHGCNFSFKGVDESVKPIETHKDVFEALASIPTSADFFAPSPTRMNAEIVAVREVSARMWNYRNSSRDFVLFRGPFADGVSHLNKWCAYAMSAADCALIVAKSGGLIVAAHAGRDSIIDMARYKEGGEQRRHESVVENICTSVFESSQLANMQVWVGFSISPGPHFQHVKGSPRYPHNALMVDDITQRYGKECFKDDGQGGALGWLDTKELIRQQFLRFGVPEENIVLDSMCTHNDQKDGEHTWYSNVRSGEFRNLIAVVVNT